MLFTEESESQFSEDDFAAVKFDAIRDPHVFAKLHLSEHIGFRLREAHARPQPTQRLYQVPQRQLVQA